MATPTPARKRVSEIDAAIRFKRYDILDNFVRYGLKYGSFVALGWMARDVLVSYAGQYTFADFKLSFFGDLKVSAAVHWTVTIGFGLWGLGERRLRHRTTKRLAPRFNDLEKKLDKKRTSSKLTEKGTSRKEDRL